MFGLFEKGLIIFNFIYLHRCLFRCLGICQHKAARFFCYINFLSYHWLRHCVRLSSNRRPTMALVLVGASLCANYAPWIFLMRIAVRARIRVVTLVSKTNERSFVKWHHWIFHDNCWIFISLRRMCLNTVQTHYSLLKCCKCYTILFLCADTPLPPTNTKPKLKELTNSSFQPGTHSIA